MVSCLRPGRLVPPEAQGLRAAAVVLKPREAMPWHSTQAREELLVALEGRMHVAVRTPSKRARRIALRNGQSLFLPAYTWHTVVNASARRAVTYVYVTAPIPDKTTLAHSKR